MKLSIITPCSRPHNLPIIYSSILSMNTDNVEWIIVYDNMDVDERIWEYEENVPILQYRTNRLVGDNYASRQRNLGMEVASGDYLYFLDDDNLVHKLLYDKIDLYCGDNKIIIFNQLTKKHTIKNTNSEFKNRLLLGQFDTGQIAVPNHLNTRWDVDKSWMEETHYIKNLINEVGEDRFIFVDGIYTFYNYLRRFDLY